MKKSSSRHSVRLFLEVLETRFLPSSHLAGPSAIVPQLAATAPQSVSTVPPNGDLNPYGVAFVPADYQGGGRLHAGDILVSNFNNSANLQGTGTTVVQITPSGQQSVFFQGSGLGLTTALGVLQRGFVLVGNVPTSDGTFSTIRQGSLLILNHDGRLVANLTSATKLDGPWDLTINDQGSSAQVFVSNVLSGTVTRLDLAVPQTGDHIVVRDMIQIASGYAHRSDPAALVVGPTGLAYDLQRDILYVAATADNAVFAVPNAGARQTDARTGSVIFDDPARLRGPLGLVLTPDGDLITSNGDAVNANKHFPSELVEFNPTTGRFVGQFSVDSAPGSAFGIALATFDGQVHFAAVDDNTNTLDIWTLESSSVSDGGIQDDGPNVPPPDSPKKLPLADTAWVRRSASIVYPEEVAGSIGRGSFLRCVC